MSSNEIDCSALEERITGQNLNIGATEDQINKLDPQDPDAQNQREALTRKLDNLHEQLGLMQHSLEECRQGKVTNFPTLESVSESETV